MKRCVTPPPAILQGRTLWSQLPPGFAMKGGEVSYRARYLLNAYPAIYMPLSRMRHRGQDEYFVTRDTQLVIEGFGRAGNTFAWLAFRSAQPQPVRLAHHTHAAAQVITAARWHIPTLVIVRPPVDSALAHMVLRGVSPRSALTAWIRYHRRIMTVRHAIVAAAFDDSPTTSAPSSAESTKHSAPASACSNTPPRTKGACSMRSANATASYGASRSRRNGHSGSHDPTPSAKP
jgi:hypothetical protein